MISDAELAELEDSVGLALRSGDASRLRLLGEGEISLVLGAGAAGAAGGVDPVWACKRLPPFPTETAADLYAAGIERYVDTLVDRGIEVLDTDVRRVSRTDGGFVLYCVQPVLPAAALAVEIAHHDPERAPALIREIVEVVFGTVDTTVGLDAQLSNWAIIDDRLTYFDITTPLLRGSDGTSQLDTEVFLVSLPWALRAPARRFVLPAIIERYHGPRTVALDLASNLLKEGLAELVPVVLDAVSGRIVRPLTEREVGQDRRSDARTWATLQAVRRVDRAWQRGIRRRPYPFLLPTRSSH